MFNGAFKIFFTCFNGYAGDIIFGKMYKYMKRKFETCRSHENENLTAG